MQQSFNGVNYIVGNDDVLSHMENVPALPIFSENILNFLECLSKKLLTDPVAKQYADIIAYAFWIRRGSIEKTKLDYDKNELRMGRGIAFHIAPSNIPVQFAVSMTYALISGNASIIRVSDKSFPQVDIICKAINEIIIEKCEYMIPYICIVRYNHDDSITGFFSSICDIRVIWGGNNTIEAIRKSEINPRTIELCFADRYSIAVIDSDDYILRDPDILANDFYADTYYSDQNACSSPRLIIWVGSKAEEAKSIFWNALEQIVEKKYKMNAISSSEKLLNTALLAARHPGVKMIKENNLLVRVELPELYNDLMTFKGNSGYFFEYTSDDLEDIVPVLKKECQSVIYVGKIEERLKNLIEKHGIRGVDRLVPMGHGMDLTFVWDGFDLPVTMSRKINNH